MYFCLLPRENSVLNHLLRNLYFCLPLIFCHQHALGFMGLDLLLLLLLYIVFVIVALDMVQVG